MRFDPLPSACLRRAIGKTNPTIPPALDGLKRFRLSRAFIFVDRARFGRFRRTRQFDQCLSPPDFLAYSPVRKDEGRFYDRVDTEIHIIYLI